ncbi:MAG TPA: sterol desaturase family protein [Gemmataceae bacterium]|nr:sterol desaturase family protein [Gemmataceae bacterium]
MELFKDSFILAVTLPAYLVLIWLEVVVSHVHGRPYYTLKGTATNVGLAAVNIGLDLAMRGFWFAALAWGYQFHSCDPAGGLAYWVALLLLQDFLFYWLHRVDHTCRLFWAVHSTHHSAGEFNLTVGFRPSVLQPVYRFAWFLPLPVIGFRPEDVLLMYSVTQLYGVLVHTRYVGRLGPLEWFLCTPSHHRVHHGINPAYRDKNLGMVLIVWDRLFGTFVPETEEVRFGWPGPANPLRVILAEWRAMAGDLARPGSLATRLKYVFGPPGWRAAPAPSPGERP